jgi:hypothetical protein
VDRHTRVCDTQQSKIVFRTTLVMRHSDVFEQQCKVCPYLAEGVDVGVLVLAGEMALVSFAIYTW